MPPPSLNNQVNTVGTAAPDRKFGMCVRTPFAPIAVPSSGIASCGSGQRPPVAGNDQWTRAMMMANVRRDTATPAHHFRETVFPENAQAAALARVNVWTVFRVVGITGATWG